MMDVVFCRDEEKIETHSSLRCIVSDKIELAESRAKDVINEIQVGDYLGNSKSKLFYLGVETRKGNCIALKVVRLRNSKYRYQLLSCHINEIDYIIKEDSWVVL
jgi:hypothetical protein